MFELGIEEDQYEIEIQSARLKNISPQNEFLKQGGHLGDIEVVFSDDLLKLQNEVIENRNQLNELEQQKIKNSPRKLQFQQDLIEFSSDEANKKNNQRDLGQNQYKTLLESCNQQESSRFHSTNNMMETNLYPQLKQSQSQQLKTTDYKYNNSLRHQQSEQQGSNNNLNKTKNNFSGNGLQSSGGIQSHLEKQKEKNLEAISIYSQQKQWNKNSTKEIGKNGQKMLSSKQREFQDQRDFKQTKELRSIKEIKDNERIDRAIKIIQKVLSSQLDKVERIDNQVKRFINILLIKSGNFAQHLDKQNLQSIGDKSYYYQSHDRNHFSLNVFAGQISDTIIKNLKIKAFMPTETFRIFWDLIHLIFTSLFLYGYSILIFCAQQEKLESQTVYISSVFVFAFCFFSIDVLVNFNTAYFKKDLVVTNHSSIASKYFQSYFFSDITALFILALKVFDGSRYAVYNPTNDLLTHAKNTLLFLKAAGLSSKLQRIQSVITLKDYQKHVLKLLNLIISIVIVAHIIGIGWNVMEIIEKSYGIEDTWTVKYNIADNDWQSKYIFSFYWSVTTMTTVGFGDITPANKYEAFFLSATMIFLSCIFAYSINNIGMILQEIQRNQKELTDNVSTIQKINLIKIGSYLTRKNVNIALKSRVRNYLHFLAEEEKDRNKDKEDKVFKKLSNKLRDEITLEVNTRILNSSSIFTKNFSVQTLNKIVFKMVEQVISPNEIIFKQGDNTDQSIYFIFNGSIEIYNSTEIIQKGQQIQSTIFSKRLQSNQIFGEIQFFTGHARSASAKSVNLSTLYKLSQKDFLEILNENPEDLERYKMIQEQIIFQHDYSFIGLECYSCNQNGHIAQNCHIIHKKIDKQFHNLKSNFSYHQTRQTLINPRRLQRFQPLINVAQIKNAQKIVKEQMIINGLNNQSGQTNNLSNSDDDDEEDDDSLSSSNFTNMTNSINVEEEKQDNINDRDHNSIQLEDSMNPTFQAIAGMAQISPILTKFLFAQLSQEQQQKGIAELLNNRKQTFFDKTTNNDENCKEENLNFENMHNISSSPAIIQQIKNIKKQENDKQIDEKRNEFSKQYSINNRTSIQTDTQNNLKEINIPNFIKPEKNSEFIPQSSEQLSNQNIQSSQTNSQNKKNLFEKQQSKKINKRGIQSITQIIQNVGTSSSLGTSDEISTKPKKEEGSEKLIKFKGPSQKDIQQLNPNLLEENIILNELNSMRSIGNKQKSDERPTSLLQQPIALTYQDLTRLISQTIITKYSINQTNTATANLDKQKEERRKKESQLKEIDFISINFDCYKIFNKFFPHNNLENILQDFKLAQIIKKKEVKQKQKITYLNKNRRQNIFNNNIEGTLPKQSMCVSRGSMSFKQFTLISQDNNNNNNIKKGEKPTFINYGYCIPSKKTPPINLYALQFSASKL